MASIIPAFEYDIFISYRHNDNRSGWVTEFVKALQEELAATIKEPVSVYFDSNPHDGLLETHDVDGSLKDKLKCLIFIPVISRTYCDTKSFAWNHEFLEFLKIASADSFGLKIKLPNSNMASRVLPVRIHELDGQDKQFIEAALQGPLRAIDFTYQTAGVNRPLLPKDDESIKGSSQVSYRDQINKTANAIGDLLAGLQGKTQSAVAFRDKEKKPPITQSSKKKVFNLPKLQASSLIIIALFAALAALSFIHFSLPATDAKTYVTSIASAENVNFGLGTTGGLALSPDGSTVAYVAIDSANKSYLWVRHLNTLQSLKLEDTEGAFLPFWSPNNQQIGFFANGKLKRVAVDGGPSLALCDVGIARGGSWNKDGIIIFTENTSNTISKISSTGGKPTSCTTFDSVRNEVGHRWPHFLPDGNHFIYTARTDLSLSSEQDAIVLASLDSSFTPRLIMHASSNAEYANGHLVYAKGQTLMTQPFDLGSLQLESKTSRLTEHLYYEGTTFYGSFSLSQSGSLIYHNLPPDASTNTLILYNREGKPLQQLNHGNSDNYVSIRFSPNNQKVALSYYDGRNPGQNIWLYDLPDKIRTRFTFGKAADRTPVWSLDGQKIVFSSNRNKKWEMFMRKANGEGSEEVLTTDGNSLTDWSSDGKYILSWVQGKNNPSDIWVHPIGNTIGDKSRKPFAFLATEFAEDQAAFSPNGQWIAYRSNESGNQEIYVRPFPSPGGKWQVSAAGGSRPHWRGDGKELFFLSTNFKMMSAKINMGISKLEIGEVKPLFSIRPLSVPLSRDIYDVTSDGQKFLVESFLVHGSAPTMTLIVNWPGEVKDK